MATQKPLTLALTATLLFCTGCSGARLKNLIGRNDYSTLEELEREDDAYAELYDEAESDPASRLVSQTREVDDPVDPVEDPPSRFSFGRLFGRDRDDEFADLEDPFAGTLEDRRAVEELNAEIQRLKQQVKEQAAEPTRTVVDAAEQTDRAVEQAGRYVASLEQVEQQAEAMFDDLSEATDERFDRTAENPFATASASQVVEETVERTSESFADFLNQNQPSESGNPFASPESPATDLAAATDAGLNFDSLVSESGRESAFADAVSRQEQLFPEASDVFADALGMSDQLDSTGDVTASAASAPFPRIPTADAAAATPAGFETAAESHGFGPLKSEDDPWAAFAAGQSAQTAAAPAPVEPQFQWGQSSESDAANALAASPVAAPSMDLVPSPVAANAFDANPAAPFELVSQSTESALVIPEQVPSDQPVIELPVADASTQPLADPFVMEPAFDDLDQIPAEDLVTESVQPVGTEGGPATITAAPNRMWFFILGCVALAALLFLPSRQSQKN
ncbi:MAG: hypothetical protein NXI04_10180 [Planctomycetaceae bacterium]|nr:hypothetical protein [Planctomycetaceae bacterium]